jgi:hypothetical protein
MPYGYFESIGAKETFSCLLVGLVTFRLAFGV